MANPEWTDVYDEIRDERQRQDAKWGGPEHDDAHQINDFIAYITKHAGRCVDAKSYEVRQHMIRVAALAVAVVQKIDRSHGKGPDKEAPRRPEVLHEGERWFYGGPDNDACTRHRLYKEDGTERFVASDEYTSL